MYTCSAAYSVTRTKHKYIRKKNNKKTKALLDCVCVCVYTYVYYSLAATTGRRAGRKKSSTEYVDMYDDGTIRDTFFYFFKFSGKTRGCSYTYSQHAAGRKAAAPAPAIRFSLEKLVYMKMSNMCSLYLSFVSFYPQSTYTFIRHPSLLTRNIAAHFLLQF